MKKRLIEVNKEIKRYAKEDVVSIFYQEK